jgi:hypothetical protein
VAEERYRDAVQVAEAHRLEMEERIERGLRVWERWERERLGVFQQGELDASARAREAGMLPRQPQGRKDESC